MAELFWGFFNWVADQLLGWNSDAGLCNLQRMCLQLQDCKAGESNLFFFLKQDLCFDNSIYKRFTMGSVSQNLISPISIIVDIKIFIETCYLILYGYAFNKCLQLVFVYNFTYDFARLLLRDLFFFFDWWCVFISTCCD